MMKTYCSKCKQRGNNVTGPSNLNEILKNYRDRAEERRKGVGKDENIDDLHANNAYRAVPADVRATADAAQRRKQAIQVFRYIYFYSELLVNWNIFCSFHIR